MPYPVYNPYLSNQYTQGLMPQMLPQQPVPLSQLQQQQTRILVDGPTEAMNRFLMMYPASMLVPGFISGELFDVNGKQFHTLSIEPDGRRNLETFDYKPHVEQNPARMTAPEYVERSEFQLLADKVNQLIEGGDNGVHESVPATAAGGNAPTA